MKILLQGILLFSIVSVESHADFFETPLKQANWTLNGSKTQCHLKHEIPYYGSADFVHNSGETLRFSIQERRVKPQIVKANLSAFPSPWVHEAINPEQYLVYLDAPADIKSYAQLAVYGTTAETMIDALLQGQYPTFSYIRASSELDLEETRVAVSAINFIETYDEFLQCRNQLLPYGIRDLQDSLFYFDNNRQQLNSQVKDAIRKLVNFMDEIKDTRVVIGSETFIGGNADKKWFAKRAEAIANELKKQGISNDRVSVENNFQDAGDQQTIRMRIFGPDGLKWIFYRKGNTKLTRLEKQRLDLLARYMLEYRRYGRLIIHSHTDSKGARAKNKTISRNRANVVKKYLQSRGVPTKLLIVKAHGENRPVSSNRTRQGRAKNRRIQFEFSS